MVGVYADPGALIVCLAFTLIVAVFDPVDFVSLVIIVAIVVIVAIIVIVVIAASGALSLSLGLIFVTAFLACNRMISPINSFRRSVFVLGVVYIISAALLTGSSHSPPLFTRSTLAITRRPCSTFLLSAIVGYREVTGVSCVWQLSCLFSHY